MSRSTTLFVCQNCGSEHRKWMGQCPDCQAWNSITEQVLEKPAATGHARPITTAPITEISGSDTPRRTTCINELDRVLGGGLVTGSAVLIGGDPGIGKSTLLLQAACRLAEQQGPVLYMTGEESVQQVRMRGERIEATHADLHLAASTDMEAILATIGKLKPGVVIIDSIQTTTTNRLTSAPGTVAQVRDCAAALIGHAKQHGHALVLVGHVTKDGSLAGPRVLEHMVDSVLYFEGDRGHAHRILRAVKNRFGPAGEIGVFEMTDRGLLGIRDASKLFLAERNADAPGSVILACMEGTRPLLVEVQALVAPSVYSTPKRTAIGLDTGRVGMLTAVLERRIGLPLGDHDVYVNVVGGARIMEPAADLAIMLAILSAYREKPMPADMAVFGEVGLTGEVRAVGRPEARVREAANLGFGQLLIPKGNHTRVDKEDWAATIASQSAAPVACTPVRNMAEAAQAGFA
ncbi:MAG TPA: DNA repair protein RadA [Mariprofundaceae bacterium]|nr:DNA repair protein RadA [Mariprofundaceae bacterium]